MKLPKKVLIEIQSFLKDESTRVLSSLLYKSNFTDITWEYLKHLSKEDLFNIQPPKRFQESKTLSHNRHRRGQLKDTCIVCCTKTKFISYKLGYSKFCSKSCDNLYARSKETKEHLDARMLKTQNTMLERHGGKTTLHCPAMKAKLLTNSKFYTNRSENMAKALSTKIKKYGVKTKSEEQINRAKKTYQNSLLKNPQILAKSWYQRKEVTVNGVTFKVQGIEDQVIVALVKLGVKSISINPISVEWFDSKKRRHIYIPDLKFKYKQKLVHSRS